MSACNQALSLCKNSTFLATKNLELIDCDTLSYICDIYKIAVNVALALFGLIGIAVFLCIFAVIIALIVVFIDYCRRR